ncbi:MAG TPA: hypothetical protein VKH35_05460 [Thermoanaerobaculia bacterium]|nr:hypothetical protein [Thermoanaerobaculia bacterium]
MIIEDRDRAQITKMFSVLDQPVKFLNFTQTFECETCHDTRQLFEELTSISPKLSLEVFNFTLDKEVAAQYRIDKIPATVLVGEKDHGIRYYGIPAGFEFASVIEDTIMLSKRDSGLEQETREKLAAITQPVHLQVLVTPT